MGIASIFSRGITVMAPMVAELAFPAPIIVFVCLTTTSGITTIFLIEEEKDTDEKLEAPKHEEKLNNKEDYIIEDLELKKEKVQ